MSEYETEQKSGNSENPSEQPETVSDQSETDDSNNDENPQGEPPSEEPNLEQGRAQNDNQPDPGFTEDAREAFNAFVRSSNDNDETLTLFEQDPNIPTTKVRITAAKMDEKILAANSQGECGLSYRSILMMFSVEKLNGEPLFQFPDDIEAVAELRSHPDIDRIYNEVAYVNGEAVRQEDQQQKKQTQKPQTRRKGTSSNISED